jgi:hypothetical protein
MSSAFVRERDEQWLHDIPPTLNALIVYLTRENNGIRVYEKEQSNGPNTSKPVYLMSNGLSYTTREDKWIIV